MALLYKVVCKWGTGYLDDSCLIRDEATRKRELRALWAEADRIAENHRDELFDENGRLKKHYQSADENAQYFDLRDSPAAAATAYGAREKEPTTV